MAERQTGVKAALRGFVEGLLICLVALLAARLFRGDLVLALDWPYLLTACVGAGLIFAVGRGIAGGTLGAFVGALIGLALGAMVVAPALPQWNLAIPREDQPDETVGRPCALAGPTLDGKQIRVADYRGKVVLVDFWATWCGPCVAELPNVLAAYRKYHDDGFEVIGVSLDTSREKLEKFVGERKVPWPQVFFDDEEKRGWASPLAREHGIRAIPATFLLDQEGKVAATDLRGEEVGREVARLLGEGAGGDAEPGVRRRFHLVPMTLYLSMAGCAVALAVAGAFLQRRVSP